MPAIFESALDCVITIDHRGYILEFNAAAEATFGYARLEVLGKEMAELIIPPSQRDQHRRGLEKYLASGVGPVLGKRIEMVGMRADGTEFPVELSITRINDEDPPVFTGFLRDITGRNHTEKALRESEQRFRALIENSRDAIALFAADGTILYGSPSTTHILGYKLEEFTGRNAFELIHPEDQAYVTERLRMSANHARGHVNVYARVLHKNGTWRWLEGVFTNLLDEPGVHAIVNNYHDITESRQAEEKIAYQAHLLENINDAVIGVDKNSMLTFWNQAAERMFGWTAEEVVGRSGTEILRSEILNAKREEVLSILEENGRWQGEALQYRKDGTQVVIEVSTITLRDDSGSITGYVSVNRDISERKKTEHILRASEERFRLIVGAAPSAMVAVDASGKINLMNIRAEELFGYPKEELLGRPIEMLIPDRFRGGHLNHRQGFFAQPASRAMGAGRDLFGLHKDGHEVPIEIGLTPYESSEGLFTLALIVDITARKQAEDEIRNLNAELEQRVIERTGQLQESEEKFSKAFLNSPAAVSIASIPDGRYINVNEALAQLTGYSKEELIGHTSTELGLVDSAARAKILDATTKHGFARNVEIQIHTKSNQIADVLTSIEQIEIGGRPCLLSVNYDLTGSKPAED